MNLGRAPATITARNRKVPEWRPVTQARMIIAVQNVSALLGIRMEAELRDDEWPRHSKRHARARPSVAMMPTLAPGQKQHLLVETERAYSNDWHEAEIIQTSLAEYVLVAPKPSDSRSSKASCRGWYAYPCIARSASTRVTNF